MNCLMVPEARSLRSGWQQGCAPLKAPGRGLVQTLLLASSGLGCCLACRRITPPSSRGALRRLLCMLVCLWPNLPFYKVTSHSDLGPKPDELLFSLIETLFPNRSHSQVLGVGMSTYEFLGDRSRPVVCCLPEGRERVCCYSQGSF